MTNTAKKDLPICDRCHNPSQFITAYDTWMLCDECLKIAQRDEWALQPIDEHSPEKSAEAKRQLGELNEPVLADDYPVYVGYMYVVEFRPRANSGETWLEVTTSDIEGTVADLKRKLEAAGQQRISHIRRCDISGRNLWHLMV